MVEVARTFRSLLDGELDGEAAEGRLAELFPIAPLANGFLFGREGMLHFEEDHA